MDRSNDSYDWRRLAARHDAAPHEDDAAWLEALEALDADPDAHPEALEADPLLLFRRLPEPEVDAAEIAAMREAVAGLRRASDLARLGSDAPPVARPIVGRQRLENRRSIGTLAAALVAAMVGALFLLPSGETAVPEAAVPEAAVAEAAVSERVVSERVVSEAVPRVEIAPPSPAEPAPSSSAALASFDGLPLVEEGDARPWIQIEDDTLSLVVVDLDRPTDFDV